MGLFDDNDLAAIQANKQKADEVRQQETLRFAEQQRNQQELIALIVQGIREFPTLARQVGLEPNMRFKLYLPRRDVGLDPQPSGDYIDGWRLWKPRSSYDMCDGCHLIGVDGRCHGSGWPGSEDDTTLRFAKETHRKFGLYYKSLEEGTQEVRRIFAAALAGDPLES